jgi:hypothetical protein
MVRISKYLRHGIYISPDHTPCSGGGEKHGQHISDIDAEICGSSFEEMLQTFVEA